MKPLVYFGAAWLALWALAGCSVVYERRADAILKKHQGELDRFEEHMRALQSKIAQVRKSRDDNSLAARDVPLHTSSLRADCRKLKEEYEALMKILEKEWQEADVPRGKGVQMWALYWSDRNLHGMPDLYELDINLLDLDASIPRFQSSNQRALPAGTGRVRAINGK